MKMLLLALTVCLSLTLTATAEELTPVSQNSQEFFDIVNALENSISKSAILSTCIDPSRSGRYLTNPNELWINKTGSQPVAILKYSYKSKGQKINLIYEVTTDHEIMEVISVSITKYTGNLLGSEATIITSDIECTK